MLVSSSLNPAVKSTVSFIVLVHEGSRVIVPTDSLPKFGDVFEVAGVKLSNPVLETNELDICSGEWVRIHQDAWTGLKDVLSTVYINRASSSCEPRAQTFVDVETRNEILSASQRFSKSTRSVAVKKEDTQQTTESADEGEVEQQITANERDLPTTSAEEDEDTDNEPANTTVIPKSPAKNDRLNLFGDPEERLLALKKKPKNNEGLRTQTFKPSAMRLPVKEPSSSSLKPRQGTAGTSTPSRSVSPAKEVAKDKEAAPAQSPAPAQEDPERVLVLVEILGQHEPRPFRIRRDYTVHSVLKGVSKVFDFDYNRATLSKVNRDPNAPYGDDDEEELETTKLDRTDTMRTLGVTDRQRFIVEVDEDNDESD